jgi:hypothetical protein
VKGEKRYTLREGGRERGRKERKVMDMNAEREGRTRKHEGGSRRVPVQMVFQQQQQQQQQ